MFLKLIYQYRYHTESQLSSTWAWTQSWSSTTHCCHWCWWWRWRICLWANCWSMGWVGKDCWLVIKQYIVFDYWYTPVAQWVDPDTLANNIDEPEFWLTVFPLNSRATRIWARHQLFSILPHTGQDPCSFICSHYILCSKWSMWDRWHAS